MPWAVRAPTLLLIGVIGSAALEGNGPSQPPSSSASASSPLQVSYQALRNELQRRPSADLLLDSPGAVSDLCTAVELVLERLAVRGDWQAFVGLLAALLAALGGATSELCGRAAAMAVALGDPPRQALALAAAATQEAAAAALAALHATCRQVGSACARTAAAAVSSPAAASTGVAAGFLPAAPAAARTVAGPQPAASEALASMAASVHAAASAAAATATVPEPGPGGEPPGRRADPLAGSFTAGRPDPGGRGRGPLFASGRPGAAALRTLTVADPWVTLAVAAAAAGGLLEGCTLAVRLQPLGRPQELLLRLLQPAVILLSGALQESAAAASAASATASSLAAAAAPGNGVGWSACSVDADPRVFVLSAAVGYCWARLRAQPPLPGPLQPALHAADQMAAAAAAQAVTAAAAAAAGRQGAGCCWHPSRGALAVLMLGSLGVGRVLQLAAEGVGGTAVDSAVALLEDLARGALLADTQLLAKGVVEALRAPGPAAGPGLAPTGSGAAVDLAGALLADAAAAARRLHLLYGGVADSAEGRAWLAALPSVATGTLREVLDRAFVCEISVLAVAYDVLSSRGAAAAPAGPLRPTPGSAPANADAAAGSGGVGQGEGIGGAVLRAPAPMTAAAAAAALGALANLQFCALQLRAHGDLVARLSADALAAPAAALPSLLALLPCYPAFAASYGGGFAAMPVAASRLAFLLPLASSCVPHAADVSAAASAVLPYTYLLLKGAPESVVQAAHATWAALLAGLCEGSAAGGRPTGAVDGGSKGRARAAGHPGGGARTAATVTAAAGQRHDACVAVAAAMVPFYVERTCQEPVSVGDLELLEWGVRQVLQELPEAHPMKAWCTARLVRQLTGWAVACADSAAEAAAQQRRGASTRTERQLRGGSGAAGWTSPTDAGVGARIEVVQRSAAAVAMAVLLLDFPLLPHVLETLDARLADICPDRAAVIVQQLHDVWLSSDDYARKQLLEQWMYRSLVKFRVAARL